MPLPPPGWAEALMIVGTASVVITVLVVVGVAHWTHAQKRA